MLLRAEHISIYLSVQGLTVLVVQYYYPSDGLNAM